MNYDTDFYHCRKSDFENNLSDQPLTVPAADLDSTFRQHPCANKLDRQPEHRLEHGRQLVGGRAGYRLRRDHPECYQRSCDQFGRRSSQVGYRCGRRLTHGAGGSEPDGRWRGGDAFYSAGTVQNNGTIIITNASGDYGINTVGIFENKTGGLITVDGVDFAGVFINGGTFTNEATIRIGSTGSVGGMGIISTSILNNTATGQIYVDRSWSTGISAHSGTVNNQGSITVGASSATSSNTGLDIYMGIFTNNGQVNLDRCKVGIVGFHQEGKFRNNGTVKIGALQSVSDLIGDDDLANLTFSNNTGGVLQGTGKIAATRFVSAGGTLSPGYSPGIQTIVGTEDLNNGIMAIEVNGAGAAGTDYDQIVINGTAVVGGTLALSINYTPTPGAQVTIVTASSISGAFSSVTGLPANWTVQYTSVSVVLVHAGPDGNIWNGSVSSDGTTLPTGRSASLMRIRKLPFRCHP